MANERQQCKTGLVTVLLLLCLQSSCSTTGDKKLKIPWWLGGRDRTAQGVVDKEGEANASVPGNRVVGVVHLVNDLGRFVLVKSASGRQADVTEGAVWMSYDLGGRPSAKLKVSSERKGPFLVADILEGAPTRGDSVVLHGLMDSDGKVKTVPLPGGEERQILE